MTKQEIEKAIENGESVWLAYENRMALEVGKSKVLKITDDQIKYFNDYYKCEAYGFMNDFFVTKAEAEHYLHHANITRTETLPFLTWEEFLEKEYVEFFNGGKGFRLYISYINCDHIRISKYDRYNPDGDVIFELPKTEENFYKAYDECVRLFKGDKP